MAEQVQAALFAQVVFFQGIGATWNQSSRVGDVLFPREAIRRHAIDLPEIIDASEKLGWRQYLVRLLVMVFRCLFPAPDSSYSLRLSKINIAQTGDVVELAKRDRDIPSSQLVSFGISRGAATTFIRHATEPERKAKLVLLEGCPDSIRNVLEYRYGQMAADGAEWFLSRLTAYDPQKARDLAPLMLVDKFPRDVPIAFVTSKRDTSVPPEGTLRLVEALRKSGHPMVHLLVLEDAGHDSYLSGSERDRRAYVDFVKELHKTYNIRYATRWFGDDDDDKEF